MISSGGIKASVSVGCFEGMSRKVLIVGLHVLFRHCRDMIFVLILQFGDAKLYCLVFAFRWSNCQDDWNTLCFIAPSIFVSLRFDSRFPFENNCRCFSVFMQGVLD